MGHRSLPIDGSPDAGCPHGFVEGAVRSGYHSVPFCFVSAWEDLYKVVEIQLSLMHDVFYTKVVVMHSNPYGLFMHILVPMATTAAFVLFLLTIQGGTFPVIV